MKAIVSIIIIMLCGAQLFAQHQFHDSGIPKYFDKNYKPKKDVNAQATPVLPDVFEPSGLLKEGAKFPLKVSHSKKPDPFEGKFQSNGLPIEVVQVEIKKEFTKPQECREEDFFLDNDGEEENPDND